ncbi:exonuclease V gamma subunit [Marmoricola sp. URHA0025 HA25]
MSGPLPLPLKTGHAWARRRLAGAGDSACRYAAEQEWDPRSSRFPGENADAAHRFVWGEHAPLGVLLGAPLAGEEHAGESTRLGSLAMRLWAPILQSVVRR